MSFAVGSLVKTRGREWVVLPGSDEEILMVRPLGGTDDETTGIHRGLEPVEPASFALPDSTKPGDYRSCRLLRDAVRLGFRSSAGPFRSFAGLAVEPRPYQLVPLLVGLKLDPVRLLIADDVGIGKTIEAGLLARELLDRAEVERLAVLCPPHLAEQWRAELRDKFHLEAELVLPSTATRLERRCRLNQSLFELHPHVIVSTDFIKAERRRDEFVRNCPELVIVDEAHTCAWGNDGRGGRHHRYDLISRLAENSARHLILVTATPHSGNEEAFRSLLKLLDPAFADLPRDLSGPRNQQHRRALAAHFVQRRRSDIRAYLDAETPFPDREEREETYSLSPEYRRLFDRVMSYAREKVTVPDERRQRVRVRWWAALALLRALASSPAAAAATLRNRAIGLDTETPEEVDELGRRSVLDLTDEETLEGADLNPGGDAEEEGGDDARESRRLRDLAREADALQGDKDAKLKHAIKLIGEMIKDGYHPIVFCRFIATAEYVADALRRKLKGVTVAAVTGALPPAEREARVMELRDAEKRVLVCTDCLSEGVNLQDLFDAVFHYDLSWNPTRHEQREGRVDRFGQSREKVRMLTYYGADNQIDGLVLDVLIRKHKSIRTALGVSVPIPVDAEKVVEALFEGLLLRGRAGAGEQEVFDFLKPTREDVHRQWDSVTDREKRSRTMFAHDAMTAAVDELAGRELQAVRAAIGSSADVAAFTRDALRAHRALVTGDKVVEVDLTETPAALREALNLPSSQFRARFEPSSRSGQPGELLFTRTHPAVEGLANYVLETSLDPISEADARRQGIIRAARCGVIETRAVQRRTTALLLRSRYHIITRRGDVEHPLLAEDCRIAAFTGSPQNAEWLDDAAAEALLAAVPDANVEPDRATHFLERVLEEFDQLRPQLESLVNQRAEELLAAHIRVRDVARAKGLRYRVEAQLPPDVLGIYVYLPR